MADARLVGAGMTTLSSTAAVASAGTVGLLLSPSSCSRLLHAVSGSGGGWSGRRDVRVAPAVALAAALAAAVIGPFPAGLVAVCLVAGSLVRRWRVQAATAARVEATLPVVCDHLARLLTAGATPIDALRGAAASAPPPVARAFREAAAVGELGGSPAEALARAGPARALLPIAASWAATATAGAPLAPALRGVGAALLADREHRRAVDTELAGARLTGWLLAALPIFGFGVAASLGARSVSILMGTPLGLVCLAGAAAFDAVGVLWLRALARRRSA